MIYTQLGGNFEVMTQFNTCFRLTFILTLPASLQFTPLWLGEISGTFE